MTRYVIHNHIPTRDVRRPYDPGQREYTGREPVATAIKNHPSVQEVSIATDSDYKYDVFLKEGWVFASGRMAGTRSGFFHNVKSFLQANPIRKTAQDASSSSPELRELHQKYFKARS